MPPITMPLTIELSMPPPSFTRWMVKPRAIERPCAGARDQPSAARASILSRSGAAGVRHLPRLDRGNENHARKRAKRAFRARSFRSSCRVDNDRSVRSRRRSSGGREVPEERVVAETGRYAPRQTHHRSARFQVTVPTPPLDAVGVTYLSSSPFAVTISLFCVVPFQLGNVAAST